MSRLSRWLLIGDLARFARCTLAALLSTLAYVPQVSAQQPMASITSIEQSHRERAEALMRDQQFAAAAGEWEILKLLNPERREYAARLEEARTRARELAALHVRAAAQARQKGEVQRAVHLYLKALGADPQNAEAANAARELEAALAARVGTRSYTRALDTSKTAGKSIARSSGAVAGADRHELESAVILLHQGDYETAAQALEGYVRRYPADELGQRSLREAYAGLAQERAKQGKKEEALNYLDRAQRVGHGHATELSAAADNLRRELARDYYDRGVRAQRDDIDEAIRLWKRALEYDASLAAAHLRLEQAQRMRENLHSIEATREKP